jgi:hypothetical protein
VRHVAQIKRQFSIRPKVLLAGVVLLSTLALSGISAASTTPSGQSIQTLVADASKATNLDSHVRTQLGNASSDFDWFDNHVAGKCMYLNGCVAGDLASKKTIVLYGDSHAVMWMPAIVPFARSHHFRVDLVWLGMCPVAHVDVYGPRLGYPSGCNRYRSTTVDQIVKSKPALILVAEKTSGVRREEAVFYTSPSQWKGPLITTLRSLRSHGSIPVAVIEDTPFFPWSVPECLSKHPNSIQQCSVPYPETQYPGMQLAERSAAAATGSSFLPTIPWLCNRRCPGVIHSTIVYVDGAHLSQSYAKFLSPAFSVQLSRIISSSKP